MSPLTELLLDLVLGVFLLLLLIELWLRLPVFHLSSLYSAARPYINSSLQVLMQFFLFGAAVIYATKNEISSNFALLALIFAVLWIVVDAHERIKSISTK